MLHSRTAQLLQGHSRSSQGRTSLPVLAKKRDPENKLKRRKRREWELNRDLEQHWTASTQKRDVWFELDERGFWVEHRRTPEEVHAFNARKASQRPLPKKRPTRQDLLKTSLEDFGLPPLQSKATLAQQNDSAAASYMDGDGWQQEDDEEQLGQYAANAGSSSWDAEQNFAAASASGDDSALSSPQAGASWQQQQQQLNQQQHQQQRQEQEWSQSNERQIGQQPTGGSSSLPPLPMDDDW